MLVAFVVYCVLLDYESLMMYVFCLFVIHVYFEWNKEVLDCFCMRTSMCTCVLWACASETVSHDDVTLCLVLNMQVCVNAMHYAQVCDCSNTASVCGWTQCMPLQMLHTELCAVQDVRVMLMDVYRKMKAPTRAYPHLPKIIEGKKDDPACLIVSGDLARRSSDFQMALQCFDQVQTMDNPQLAEMVSLFFFVEM